jgi:hypothetical protein
VVLGCTNEISNDVPPHGWQRHAVNTADKHHTLFDSMLPTQPDHLLEEHCRGCNKDLTGNMNTVVGIAHINELQQWMTQQSPHEQLIEAYTRNALMPNQLAGNNGMLHSARAAASCPIKIQTGIC